MDLLYCTVRAVLLLLNLAKILIETLLFSCCWWSLSACKTIQSLTLSVINIFNLSLYSSCFLFNCLLSFCYFMHCVHTNVITSQCWSCSNQFPSVELIRSSAAISADHFCQHVVFGFGICLFLPPFFFFLSLTLVVTSELIIKSRARPIGWWWPLINRTQPRQKKKKKLIQKSAFQLVSVCLRPSKGLGEKCSPVLGLCAAPHPRWPARLFLLGTAARQLSIRPSIHPSFCLPCLWVTVQPPSSHTVWGDEGLWCARVLQSVGERTALLRDRRAPRAALADACMWIQEAYRLALPGRLWLYFI